MSADILPFTPKHAAAYDRAISDTLIDLRPLFEAARNGMASRKKSNADELHDGIAEDSV